MFVLGASIGNIFAGYLFDRFGSIISFKFLSGFVLGICITQATVNHLINRFSAEDDDVRRNVSN